MERQTTESGEEYLNSVNFKSLIEWITAESLLSRPDDPLVFAKLIIEKKMSQRSSGEKYNPEHASNYIKQCYLEASSSADETGRIAIREPAEVSITPTDGYTKKRLILLEKLISASRVIAQQLDPLEATQCIIHETCRILEADRATLFTHDVSANELVLSVAEGAQDIRVPFGQGIAGTVAATGESINIEDVYSDPRFDSYFDMQSGYKTHTILCVPVKNGDGITVGVMQAINKHGGPFTQVDEEVLGILAAQAGIALHNANIHRLALKSKERVRSLLDIIHAMHSDMGIASLMFTITQRVQNLVDSDRCTLFMLDKSKNELWAMQGEVNIRISITQGIAGHVASTGEIINIRNAYVDPRFNQDVDKKSGYKTNTILAMPLKNQKKEVIGVLQLINKVGGHFNEEDEEILQAFLNIAGPIMENSQLFARSKSEDGSGNEFTGKMQLSSRHEAAVPEMNKITEEDDNEDEC